MVAAEGKRRYLSFRIGASAGVSSEHIAGKTLFLAPTVTIAATSELKRLNEWKKKSPGLASSRRVVIHQA
jgi:hypothetical protein